MPVTTVATNDVLTASHFNTNYRDQVVSTVTSATRPSGTEGQLIYETDTDRIYIYTGSTWELFHQHGAWTGYTPTVEQGATTNIAKTSTDAKYKLIGKTCFVILQLVVTGTGTATSTVLVTLPFTGVEQSQTPIGTAEIYDSSATTRYVGIAESWTSTKFIIATSATGANHLGAVSFTAALANNDRIGASLTYEIA